MDKDVVLKTKISRLEIRTGIGKEAQTKDMIIKIMLHHVMS
jgi:hypothetical protein